jgi:Restriction endonuclease XhoI
MCTLPGWFRPTKNWDLLALDNGELVSAIELKSINSSFGNNANNRAEESIGSAFDAHTAFDEHLLGSSSIPPVMGYVMIVHDCPDSRIVGRGCGQRIFRLTLISRVRRTLIVFAAL